MWSISIGTSAVTNRMRLFVVYNCYCCISVIRQMAFWQCTACGSRHKCSVLHHECVLQKITNKSDDNIFIVWLLFVAIFKGALQWRFTYSVSQKSSPLKLFAIFSLVVNLCNWKLPWLLRRSIAQTYSYVFTNFGPFIWIFVWIVSFLLVRPLKF